jgi:tetratricopeptide (TPR) repeat protein
LQAQHLCIITNDARNEVGVMSNIAVVHLNQAHYGLALDQLLECLRKIEISDVEISPSGTLNNLAIAYHYLELFPDAADAYRRSAEITHEEGDNIEEGKTRLNLAQTLLRVSQIDEAEEALVMAEKLLDNTDNHNVMAVCMATRATILLKRNQAEEAFKLARQSCEDLESCGQPQEKMGARITLAECYKQVGQLEQAEYEFKSCLTVALELQLLKDALECCNYLVALFSEHEQFEVALEYQQQATRIHETLFTNEAARIKSEAEVKHRTEKHKQNAIALAKANAELRDANEQIFNQKNELEEAVRRIKQLSGLIPICSCCKKIRDDAGYWQQLEVYISEHSQAVFSHGICPDCVDNFE